MLVSSKIRAPETPSLVRTTLLTLAVTAGAQLVGCPIDVVSRLGTKGVPMSAGARMGATLALVRTSGPLALFRGLPMHILKRAPTKALTVCLFEALHGGSAVVTGGTRRKPLNALFAGMLALSVTYPLSVVYYGARKGLALSAIAARARATAGGVLYAGLAPALLAVAPSVAIDYCIYQNSPSVIGELHTHTNVHVQEEAQARTPPGVLALAPMAGLMLAAVGSKILGGLVAAPMKTVARRSAQAALKGNAVSSAPLALVVARELASKGAGEFWRGFPRRAVRYSLTAIVSKTAMQGARKGMMQ